MSAAPGLTAERLVESHSSTYFEPHIETMSRERLQVLQEQRLYQMLRFAYQKAPLIRMTWDAAGLTPSAIKSLADFREKAPLISKDMVRAYRDTYQDPFGGLHGTSAQDLRGLTFTSGTTGDPTPVPRGDRSTIEWSMIRDIWMMGARPGDFIATVRPTFRIGHIGPYHQDVGFKPVLFSHTPRELPRFVEAAKRYGPTSVYFLSNPLLTAFEDMFERTGIDPREVFASFKGVCFGGEPLSDRRRAMVQSWGVVLHELTGLGESVSALQCSAQQGMHAWEDHVIVECLHPITNEPVEDGQLGELVVTVLTDPFSPTIRYRTDDMVTLDRSPCACGRTHVRLRIMGRRSDQTIVSDRLVMPRELLSIIEGERATRAGLYQIIRYAAKMEVLRVRVGHDPSVCVEGTATLAARLGEQLSAALEVRVAVEIVADAELLKLGPPHKIPRVTKS
jgi:phenylacetate-CoA ligase